MQILNVQAYIHRYYTYAVHVQAYIHLQDLQDWRFHTFARLFSSVYPIYASIPYVSTPYVYIPYVAFFPVSIPYVAFLQCLSQFKTSCVL